jgi:glucokinase
VEPGSPELLQGAQPDAQLSSMWSGGVAAGEGAHATFAPRGWKQQALAAFAAQKLGGHVEVEQVACGSGLELIYQFLLTDEPANKQHVQLGSEYYKVTSMRGVNDDGSSTSSRLG